MIRNFEAKIDLRYADLESRMDLRFADMETWFVRVTVMLGETLAALAITSAHSHSQSTASAGLILQSDQPRQQRDDVPFDNAPKCFVINTQVTMD